MTKQTAEYILKHSDLLIKSNCKIVDGVLYERLQDGHLDAFFTSNVEDPVMLAQLHQLFK